jgi:hypothetical protein
MDYRRTNAPQNTETRDVMKLAEPVGNVYEMVRIISKRANQLSETGPGYQIAGIRFIYRQPGGSIRKSRTDRNFAFLRKTPETFSDSPARLERRGNLLPQSFQRKRAVLTERYASENSNPVSTACVSLYAGGYGNPFGFFFL